MYQLDTIYYSLKVTWVMDIWSLLLYKKVFTNEKCIIVKPIQFVLHSECYTTVSNILPWPHGLMYLTSIIIADTCLVFELHDYVVSTRFAYTFFVITNVPTRIRLSGQKKIQTMKLLTVSVEKTVVSAAHTVMCAACSLKMNKKKTERRWLK